MPVVLVLVSPLSVASASAPRLDDQHLSDVAVSVAARPGAESARTGINDGYWQTIRERVWVPGASRVVYEPALWEWRFDSCGRRVRVCVRPAGSRVVQDPGCYQWQTRRVWVQTRAPLPQSRGHRPSLRERGFRRGVGGGRGRVGSRFGR